MKRNKYNPSYHINSIRKRNCVKKRVKYKIINGYSLIDMLDDLEYSNDRILRHNYMKSIKDIMENYYEKQNLLKDH